MDPQVIAYLVSAGAVGFGLLFWTLWAKVDKAQEQRQSNIDAAFAEHRAREEKFQEELAGLRLEMAGMAKREDLAVIFQKFDELKNTIIGALAQRAK